MTVLYVVSTPLGNLDDITFRAVNVLREVGAIASEDTRTTGRLLAHFEIKTRLLSYHEHSKPHQIKRILDLLTEHDVALVSEAGTPLLSDPGYKLVQAAIQHGFDVVAIPGASALLTALPVSGLPTDQFLFVGFLPRKSTARQTLFEQLRSQLATLIFYESPHRVQASLVDMAAVFGNDRSIAVCRELTKLHEEIWRGTLAQAVDAWAERTPRGEFTLVVAGAPEAENWSQEAVEQAIVDAIAGGTRRKDAVKLVTQQSGWLKRDVYALAERMKKEHLAT
ncbi:16S rRNA (cytidine(1402)-2'-O)-methyltransferase [Anaerolineales bacterium HSG25]|nr:16S rRNA (cytidine(1402)-2'-O)-methyltransferase [Anaerolineales bacterium HSG25]